MLGPFFSGGCNSGTKSVRLASDNTYGRSSPGGLRSVYGGPWDRDSDPHSLRHIFRKSIQKHRKLRV